MEKKLNLKDGLGFVARLVIWNGGGEIETAWSNGMYNDNFNPIKTRRLRCHFISHHGRTPWNQIRVMCASGWIICTENFSLNFNGLNCFDAGLKKRLNKAAGIRATSIKGESMINYRWWTRKPDGATRRKGKASVRDWARWAERHATVRSATIEWNCRDKQKWLVPSSEE